jgi:hypothetical protein
MIHHKVNEDAALVILRSSCVVVSFHTDEEADHGEDS